jgi:hypothetical protein
LPPVGEVDGSQLIFAEEAGVFIALRDRRWKEGSNELGRVSAGDTRPGSP